MQLVNSGPHPEKPQGFTNRPDALWIDGRPSQTISEHSYVEFPNKIPLKSHSLANLLIFSD